MRPRARPWPIAALFALAAVALALEALLAWPRGAGLALRLATLAVVVVGARLATARAPRRVVFVLDVSKSMLADDAAPNRLARAKAHPGTGAPYLRRWMPPPGD